MDIQSAAREIKPIGLKECLREIFDLHSTGILKEGLVRDFADEVVFKITNDSPTKLKIAEDVLLREAARRYLEE